MTQKPAVTKSKGEAPLSPQMEQAYRRLSRRAVIATVAVMAVVLAAAGLIGSGAISRRFEGAKDLDRAMTLLRQADEVVLDIDDVVRSELNTATAAMAMELRTQIPSAKGDLEEAANLIQTAMGKVTEDEQRRARLVRESVRARLEMLQPAHEILAVTAKAGTALDPSREGWGLVISAESTADKSVAEYNKLTKAGVTKSNALIAQARRDLTRARALFSQATTAFPEAGLNRYVDFIDAKNVLLALSKQSNDAWLKGDVSGGNAVIARYNAKDKKVIALAADLPATPEKAIADAYEDLAGSPTFLYDQARQTATDADGKLEKF